MKSAVSAPGSRPARSGALRGALSDDFRDRPCRRAWRGPGAGYERLNATKTPDTTRTRSLDTIETHAMRNAQRFPSSRESPQRLLPARLSPLASAAR